MTPEQFNLLSPAEQSCKLYKHGVFVGKKKTAEGISMLWQYEAFYVEIVYKLYRLKMESITCHTAVDIVFEYPQLLDLKGLLVYT